MKEKQQQVDELEEKKVCIVLKSYDNNVQAWGHNVNLYNMITLKIVASLFLSVLFINCMTLGNIEI